MPELLAYIRTRIDERPAKKGQWFLTGSEEAPLMRGVNESMAGRAAILDLLPLSLAETDRVTLLGGGYPEALARPRARDLWFSSYIQTYLERDVRAVGNVRDLATFRRFLSPLASLRGQILNRTDHAAPLGVAVPTISEWLHVLEIAGQIILLPPHYENFGKRLLKSPKVYLLDSGLGCHLPGIRTQAELARSPLLGPLLEGFVAAAILKHQAKGGRRRELYFFRDQQGLEVDFLFPGESGGLWMVECETTKTVQPAMARPLQSLRRAMRQHEPGCAAIIHPGAATPLSMRTVAPGIDALELRELLEALEREASRRRRRREA